MATLTAHALRPLSLEDLETIYRAEVSEVWRFLLRMGAGREWLEDLVHDTFVVAIRRREHFDVRRPVRPWLFGIAFRLLLDLRRSASQRLEQRGPAPEGWAPAEVEALLEEREARRQVEAALQCLDLERRTVLVMHDLHELTIPDVAEALEIPVGTAYSRLRAARQQFVAAIRRQREQGESE